MISNVLQTVSPVVPTSNDDSSKDEKLRKVCSDFESLLVHYILKAGRATLPGKDLIDNSHGSEIYKSMMDEKLSISVSQDGGTGLGELLYKQLIHRQRTEKHVADFM